MRRWFSALRNPLGLESVSVYLHGLHVASSMANLLVIPLTNFENSCTNFD